MKSGSSTDNNNNSSSSNSAVNKGKAPAIPSPPPPLPTASSSSTSTSTQPKPRRTGLPPIPQLPFSIVREQDRYMPIANVVRIMRRGLPPHAKISDEAKETIQECVTEFISFVTEEANEKCRTEHRKTVTGDDLLWAMGRLGFDNYVGPLRAYLKKYRQMDAADLPKNEMATRQRRFANRSAGIVINEGGSSQQSAAETEVETVRVGVMPPPRFMPGRPLRPPAPMMPQPEMFNPHDKTQSYFDDRGTSPSSSSGPILDLGPSTSFDCRGCNGDMSAVSPSTSTESEMISFYDLLTHFK